jgi:hypothetical protein
LKAGGSCRNTSASFLSGTMTPDEIRSPSTEFAASAIDRRRRLISRNRITNRLTIVITMSAPPPYSVSDTPLSIISFLPYIPHRHYPSLALVCSEWRDVFQPLLWSQPDRYFSNPHRSANGIVSMTRLIGSRIFRVRKGVLQV